MSPSAAVLHYGQGIFEGMKAFRTPEHEIVTFHPGENASGSSKLVYSFYSTDRTIKFQACTWKDVQESI